MCSERSVSEKEQWSGVIDHRERWEMRTSVPKPAVYPLWRSVKAQAGWRPRAWLEELIISISERS